MKKFLRSAAEAFAECAMGLFFLGVIGAFLGVIGGVAVIIGAGTVNAIAGVAGLLS